MFQRLAVLKRIASSTERESEQRSRGRILLRVTWCKCQQRWLTVLISNDLTRNREVGPKTEVASRQCRSWLQFEGAGNRAQTQKCGVPMFRRSNFDGGQDIWILEECLKTNSPKNGRIRWTCIYPGLVAPFPQSYTFTPLLPKLDELDSFVDEILLGRTHDGEELVVSRGLTVAASWHLVYGVSDLDKLEMQRIL